MKYLKISTDFKAEFLLLLGVHPRETKTLFHTNVCTRMFIAALFIIARNWEQRKCPSTGEWINSGTCTPHSTTQQGQEANL